jgi:anthranilate synthase component 2
MDLIREAGHTVPIFGVCLGHQSIGAVYGGEVIRAPLPVHGKVAEIHHQGETLFRNLPTPFKATRYHSLVVRRESLPTELAVTAQTADGLIMGLSHITHPVHGVQFHPESIASEHGHALMRNFLDLAKAWNAAKRKK